MVRDAVCNAWNYTECLSEFKLGAEFVADFVVLSANSGCWKIHFIELESPAENPFLPDGTPSKSLRKGLNQIEDWQIWIKTNEAYFRSSLSTHFRGTNVPAQCSSADSHVLAHTEISDPRTVLFFNYHIFAGRRAHLSDQAQERRNSPMRSNVEISTYDRLSTIVLQLSKIESRQP